MTLRFDPFDYAFHEDPYPVYRELRAQAPAYRDPVHGFWALSRHADVLAGFKDHELFSNAGGVSLEVGELAEDTSLVLSILGMDPPRHTRMRGLVSKGFTPRRVRDSEPQVRAACAEILDAVIDRGEADLVRDIATPLPMIMIGDALGVRPEHRAELLKWSDDMLQGLATEAVIAAVRWAFENFGMERIVGVTSARNVASMRVLEHAGFVHERDTVMNFQGSEQEVTVWARTLHLAMP